MRASRKLTNARFKGRPNRTARATELGATHVMHITDHFTHESYPVYIYPGQELKKFEEQFQTVNYSITKVRRHE